MSSFSTAAVRPGLRPLHPLHSRALTRLTSFCRETETAQHIIDEAYKHVPTDPRRHDVRVAYVYLKDDEAPMVNLLHFGVQHLLPKSFARHKSKVGSLERLPISCRFPDLRPFAVGRGS